MPSTHEIERCQDRRPCARRQRIEAAAEAFTLLPVVDPSLNGQCSFSIGANIVEYQYSLRRGSRSEWKTLSAVPLFKATRRPISASAPKASRMSIDRITLPRRALKLPFGRKVLKVLARRPLDAF
jgi:hypothetical protein